MAKGQQMTEGTENIYAKRLEKYRTKSGKTIAEVASAIGVSFESYRDLELRDSEVLKCISIGKLDLLANTLEISLRELFYPIGNTPGTS